MTRLFRLDYNYLPSSATLSKQIRVGIALCASQNACLATIVYSLNITETVRLKKTKLSFIRQLKANGRW